VSSATGKPVRAVFEEAIPVAIAPTVQTVRFTPAPARIVQADPVVQWDLQLPAQGSVIVGYQAHVPAAGATRSRLLHWAQALTTIQARLSLGVVTVELKSLTVRPQMLHLAAAATAQLTLSGVLSNGKPAPSAIVSAAAWTSADPAVAIIDPAGKVTATGPGATYLTAQIGAVHATVTITVPGSQPLAQGGTGPASPNPATSGSSSTQPRVTTPPATQPPTPQPSPTPPHPHRLLHTLRASAVTLIPGRITRMRAGPRGPQSPVTPRCKWPASCRDLGLRTETPGGTASHPRRGAMPSTRRPMRSTITVKPLEA
jgi:hypothetical protein